MPTTATEPRDNRETSELATYRIVEMRAYPDSGLTCCCSTQFTNIISIEDCSQQQAILRMTLPSVVMEVTVQKDLQIQSAKGSAVCWKVQRERKKKPALETWTKLQGISD